MNNFFLLILLLSLFSCDHLPHKKTPFHCHRKRAAIDIGSGSTKIIAALVDKCQKKVLKIEHTKNFAFKFKESLHLNHNRISEELEENVSHKLKNYLEQLKREGHEVKGVATEVFRQATNGRAVISRLAKSLDIELQVINQEQEALLGFWGAVGVTGKDPQEIVVWDIGGGSMQMTAFISQTPVYYLGKLASVSFKNDILDYQGKRRGSPNPIGLHTYKWANNYAQELAKNNISSQLIKLLSQREVIGIGGVHYFSIREQVNPPKSSPYSLFDLDKSIKERIHYKDSQLFGHYRETEVSNLILVSSFMKGLQIKTVLPVKVNLATGVLFSEELW